MDGYFNKLLPQYKRKEELHKKIPPASGKLFGWMMGLEPTTLRITI